MKYIVWFEDNLNADTGIRERLMADHLAFLKANGGSVHEAGPLISLQGAVEGGLWTVDADSEADVVKLVEEDPFWPTGLRKSFRILRWKQVFANGQPLQA